LGTQEIAARYAEWDWIGAEQIEGYDLLLHRRASTFCHSMINPSAAGVGVGPTL